MHNKLVLLALFINMQIHIWQNAQKLYVRTFSLTCICTCVVLENCIFFSVSFSNCAFSYEGS